MRNKDLAIKAQIEALLESHSPGHNLKAYLQNLPDNKLRRTITILSSIYPSKLVISDEEFSFITYIFSEKKILNQENFSSFFISLNIIDFSEQQKNILINLVKENIETLCEQTTFELDTFLMRIFKPSDLFNFMKVLARSSSLAVHQHISDILRYEDFSISNVSNEALEMLEKIISKKL